MCIKKEEQLNQPKKMRIKKTESITENQLKTSWSPITPSGKNFAFKTPQKLKKLKKNQTPVPACQPRPRPVGPWQLKKKKKKLRLLR
jgi:hypothetical protein